METLAVAPILVQDHPPDVMGSNLHEIVTHPPELNLSVERRLQQKEIHPALKARSLDSSAQSCLRSAAEGQFGAGIGA
jgi:hypothetical protein